MRYGICVPNLDEFADPRQVAELARRAEDARWDGVVPLVPSPDDGSFLEGPAPAPNGDRLVARHPDGSVFEYIQTPA